MYNTQSSTKQVILFQLAHNAGRHTGQKLGTLKLEIKDVELVVRFCVLPHADLKGPGRIARLLQLRKHSLRHLQRERVLSALASAFPLIGNDLSSSQPTPARPRYLEFCFKGLQQELLEAVLRLEQRHKDTIFSSVYVGKPYLWCSSLPLLPPFAQLALSLNADQMAEDSHVRSDSRVTQATGSLGRKWPLNHSHHLQLELQRLLVPLHFGIKVHGVFRIVKDIASKELLLCRKRKGHELTR